MKTGALILLFTLCTLLQACSSQKKENLIIVFDRVDNLNTKSEVKIHGIDVGEVSGLKLIDTGVLVKIRLSEKRQIPAGSTFSIINPMIGASYIDIEPSKEPTFLTVKDTVSGKYNERGLLDNLMTDSVNRKKIQEAVEKIAEGLKELAKSKKDSTGN
ncbi:MAG: MCE family protein [Chitinophagaceae bacterium]